MKIETTRKLFTLTLSDHEMHGLKFALEGYLDKLKPKDYIGSDPEEPARSILNEIYRTVCGGDRFTGEANSLRWAEANAKSRAEMQAEGIPF